MVPIKLRWRKDKFDVDVDPSQPFELLRLQIFSLTGLPPANQRLIFKGHALTDGADWGALGIRPGAVVMLVETHGGEAAADSPQDAAAAAESPREEVSESGPAIAPAAPVPTPPTNAPAEAPAPPAPSPEEHAPQPAESSSPRPARPTPDDDRAAIDFERYDGDELQESDYPRILRFCEETGSQFVDPSFPPIPRSLFYTVAEADTWRCFMPGCRQLNPRIPDPPAPGMGPLPAARCEKCGAEAPLDALYSRPSQWLRPLEIRDDVTLQFGGTPWKVIRGEARPDDVRQGALGNCWFMGAMAVMAAQPRLVEKVFLTKEYSPLGVYQLQLCHMGLWRRVVVDDLFPCTQHGLLAYTKGARRQLWVPLLEKAAAKLFQCYEALSGGTMSEALHIVTGYPTLQIPLYRAQPPPPLPPSPDPSGDPPEPRGDDEDPDLLWAKVLSYHQAGYIMGMGCIGTTHPTKTILEVKEMGLGAPHAYSIMDVREVTDDAGRTVRLLQLRNPWGEQSPKTWRGDWGRDSPKWTFRLRRELGMVTANNVAMHDEMSVFWMSWEDVCLYFASLEVARVHPDWAEVRLQGWLACGSGPGDYFELLPSAGCQADLALVQEAHKTRELALGGRPNHVDLGLVVLRAEPSGGYTVVAQHARTVDSQVSVEVMLDGGRRYLVVPLCFSLCNTHARVGVAPRRCALLAFSSSPLSATRHPLPAALLGEAAALACVAAGKRTLVQPGMYLYTSKPDQREAGITIVAENRSAGYFRLQIDMSDTTGMVSTRGSFIVQDTLAPGKRQLLIVAAPQPNATKYTMTLGYGSGVSFGPEEQFPPIDPTVFLTSIHAPADCPLEAEARRLQETLQTLLQAMAAPGAPVPAAAPTTRLAMAEDDEEEEIQRALRLSQMECDGTPSHPAAGTLTDPEVEAAILLSLGQTARADSNTTPALASDDDSVGPLLAVTEDDMDEEAALAAALAMSMEEDFTARK